MSTPSLSAMSNPLISARGLRKNYKSGDRIIEVLRGIDFSVTCGESLSIRGESGSGKSTLLNLLAALDAPDGGDILWEGEKTLPPAKRAALIGIIFQSFYLMPELDAFSNVLMARRIVGRLDSGSKARAKELLARVGLSDRAHHLPKQLSGGERQRVALARALMNQPKLILADEPTGNLDEKTGDAVIEMLLKLCSETGTALVLVTHSRAHASRAARKLFLHGGQFEPETTAPFV